MLNLIVEVYPMDEDTLADFEEDVTGYDVLVRPDGGDPVEEHEGLANPTECVQRMLAKYPGSTEDWSCCDLLSRRDA